MSRAFSTPFSNGLRPEPFTIHVPDEKLDELRQILRLTKVGPPTYEGSHEDRTWGITTQWLREAREEWIKFDWRQVEKELNSFPQYKMQINDMDCDFDIHFVGLFSEKPDAVPIILLHGWPGSFLEFLPMLTLLQTKYTPQTLPYHIIVPSWPGYAFSSPPPLDRDFKTEDVARIFNKLMIQLGFASGYVAQGGDLGSKLARILAVSYPEAKAAHLNYCYMQKPSSISKEEYSAAEMEAMKRNETFTTMGSAYGLEQATKPSTIGLALSTSPLALLSWLGEKYLDWSDESP